MAGGGSSAGVLIVLAFMFVDKLGLAVRTPEDIAGGVKKWQDAIDDYVRTADEGLKEDASCKYDTNVRAAEYMEIIVGKTAEQLQKEFDEGAGYQEDKLNPSSHEWAMAVTFLSKGSLTENCATAHNLYCDNSTATCKPCKCETATEPVDNLCKTVAKVVEDRNPSLAGKCGSGGGGDKATEQGGVEASTTTTTSKSGQNMTSTGKGDESSKGPLTSACGSSCQLLLLIGTLASPTTLWSGQSIQ